MILVAQMHVTVEIASGIFPVITSYTILHFLKKPISEGFIKYRFDDEGNSALVAIVHYMKCVYV